jgi:hypothetical protein
MFGKMFTALFASKEVKDALADSDRALRKLAESLDEPARSYEKAVKQLEREELERSAYRRTVDKFAQAHGFEVVDRKQIDGTLWVMTDREDSRINADLVELGFKYRSGQGWWK